MSKLKVNIRSIVIFLFALMFVVAGLSLLNRYTSEQFIYRNKRPQKIGATYMTLNNPFLMSLMMKCEALWKQTEMS